MLRLVRCWILCIERVYIASTACSFPRTSTFGCLCSIPRRAAKTTPKTRLTARPARPSQWPLPRKLALGRVRRSSRRSACTRSRSSSRFASLAFLDGLLAVVDSTRRVWSAMRCRIRCPAGAPVDCTAACAVATVHPIQLGLLLLSLKLSLACFPFDRTSACWTTRSRAAPRCRPMLWLLTRTKVCALASCWELLSTCQQFSPDSCAGTTMADTEMSFAPFLEFAARIADVSMLLGSCG